MKGNVEKYTRKRNFKRICEKLKIKWKKIFESRNDDVEENADPESKKKIILVFISKRILKSNWSCKLQKDDTFRTSSE